MIRPEDFQVRIDYDETGPLVVVGHAISGIERRARPTSLESVGQVKARLLAEIKREFYDPTEIWIDQGHGRSEGKVYGMVRVTHVPTGIQSGVQIVMDSTMNEARLNAIDEVVAEVWRRKMEDAEQI